MLVRECEHKEGSTCCITVPMRSITWRVAWHLHS